MIDPHVLSRHPKIPIQERGEKRVTDLLGAAEQLFASLGYEATTMNAIASLAGSSIGSLYQFFPNKESLGNALLLEYMNELSGRIADLKAAFPIAPQVLGQKLIGIVFDYGVEHPACRVLAEVPSVQKTKSFGVYSASVQDLLSAFAPSMKAAELSSIALATLLMVRATVQGSRLVDAKTGAMLRHETQQAIGTYLEERLKIASPVSSTPVSPPRPPKSATLLKPRGRRVHG
jgi:AcrR family transcriptional regulator